MTQRKNERLFRFFCCVFTTLRAAPFQGSEASDFPVELSPDDCESVSDPVALLVELLDTKSMIAGSVKQLRLFDGLCKKLSEGGFFFRCANNSRMLHELSFFSETLGDGLRKVLVKLCSQLSQFGSHTCDFLIRFMIC